MSVLQRGPSPQPSQSKSDVSDFDHFDNEGPKSGRPDFGCRRGEGAQRVRGPVQFPSSTAARAARLEGKKFWRVCAMIPGEMFIKDGDIELNVGRQTVTVTVSNTGDRPIQVGSHYHFFETNPALTFDRAKARGMRLDIAAGTAVRFEPGQTRDVALVAFAGDRKIYGFRQEVMGP